MFLPPPSSRLLPLPLLLPARFPFPPPPAELYFPFSGSLQLEAVRTSPLAASSPAPSCPCSCNTSPGEREAFATPVPVTHVLTPKPQRSPAASGPPKGPGDPVLWLCALLRDGTGQEPSPKRPRVQPWQTQAGSGSSGGRGTGQPCRTAPNSPTPGGCWKFPQGPHNFGVQALLLLQGWGMAEVTKSPHNPRETSRSLAPRQHQGRSQTALASPASRHSPCSPLK